MPKAGGYLNHHERNLMRFLAISGSPRADGNTDTLLKTALDVIASHGIETEFISLRDKKILTCTACGGCSSENRCVLDDDFDPVYRAMVESEGFIVGSPVYFGSASGEMVALLDRAGYVARKSGDPFARKIGGPVAVARRAGQNFTYAQLLMWFMINGMVVPGSTYWNVGFGAGKGDVLTDEEGVATVKAFAENIVWLLERLTD